MTSSVKSFDRKLEKEYLTNRSIAPLWEYQHHYHHFEQRWSPRGRPWPRGHPREHILKSLALASKVKSLALASRPQVLKNWPVLGSRTAVFFELLKFCGALEKFFRIRFFEDLFFFFFFLRSPEKFLWRPFFLESTCACVLGRWPWPRAFLSLASRVSVLGKAVLGLGLGFFLCPWPWPWPRALCPRLHLWFWGSNNSSSPWPRTFIVLLYAMVLKK